MDNETAFEQLKQKLFDTQEDYRILRAVVEMIARYAPDRDHAADEAAAALRKVDARIISRMDNANS